MINFEDIKWIECNLPFEYYSDSDDPNYPEYPDLSDKEVKKYGATYQEMMDKLFHPAFKDFKIVDDDLYKQWQEFSNEHYKWSQELPEVKEYQSKINKLQKEEKQKSFCGKDLNKPGTLIELENGDIHLIGSINTVAGICNDCVEFGRDIIIKRYAIIFNVPINESKENNNE